MMVGPMADMLAVLKVDMMVVLSDSQRVALKDI